MIVYDGIALESVAPVKIEDIRVSPLRLNPVTRKRAIQFGSDFVRMNGGERIITISFAVFDLNKITRQSSLQNISEWAKSDAEYTLELPMFPDRYLSCVCTSRPEPSLRMWWENKLKIVFTCFDNPYWTSKYEKSVNCGTEFVAAGNAPPLMRIERTLSSSASNQSYSNGTQTMTFSTIPSGKLVIDLNRQTAVVGNTSIMNYYQPSGNFVIPQAGKQTITGNGTVKYRERWE